MRKTRVRVTLLTVVAAAIGGIGYQLVGRVLSRHVHTMRDLGVDFLPAAAQRIRNFHRVKVKDGKTAWEITADDAQYFEKDHQIIIIQPRMIVYLDDGARQTRISSNEGRLDMGDREVEQVSLKGHVVVELDDLRLDTEEAIYDHVHDRITAPGDVLIRGRSLDVRGKGMEVEVATQHVHLLKDVHTVLSHDAKAS